ncbi:MAG: RsmE family RNA methyltransferase [Planctomycetota bacterium]
MNLLSSTLMTRRYFSPALPAEGGLVSLSGDEAAHAARVMRARVGDLVTLFDGEGHEASAEIASIEKRECVCRADPKEVVDRESPLRLHLAIALPKPDRAKEMVERLTELGVDRLTPLRCERSQRPPSPGLLEKLPRIVVEACKQSGRNRLMRIAAVCSFPDFIQQPCDSPRWIAHPGGEILRAPDPPTDRATVVIGPEGGLTDQEVHTAREAGFQPIDLGRRILRIETAAAYVAARLL